MKAILVVNTPKDCGHCLLSDFVDGDNCLCRKADRKSKFNEKPKWCPLKPLPKKKNTSKVECFGNSKIMWTDRTIYQNEGWNACLDAIAGETE